MSSAGEKMTVREYRLRPEEAGVQLIDGSLVMEPPPNLYHQDIVVNLTLLLSQHVRSRKLGRVYVAPVGVYLSERDVLEPDVMFVSNANAAILQPDGAHGGPDLVIEVLSASTARRDAGRKRELYREHGVKEMWLIDPVRREIRRFDFRRDPVCPVETVGETGEFASPLLPGLVLSATEIFRT